MVIKVQKKGEGGVVESTTPPSKFVNVAALRRQFLASLKLPTEKKRPNPNFLAYTGLMYGREKIGKTTVLSSFPDAFFFTLEPGTKGCEIFEFNHENGGTTDWEVFQVGVKLLCAQGAGHPFKTVIIDTADRAYDFCMDYVVKTLGIDEIGRDADGQKDWGVSWRELKKEFMGQIHTLLQAGFGVWFTSHCRELTIKPKTGQEYTRIFPSMSNQARAVIEALVDFFFYCEYMRDPQGDTQRVFVCRGDETIWAGGRKTPGGEFPQFIPMMKENGYETLVAAFDGRFEGIDPRSLKPTKDTKQTAKEFLQRESIAARREEVAAQSTTSE